MGKSLIQTRILEIDLLRTVAIVLMVIYHTAYDLWAFYSWDIDLFGSFWEAVRILTASLFLMLSGISVNFSRKPLRRALIVLGCALLISAVTYIYDSSTFIYFGILHCIALGMLILIPLKHLKEWNILLGLALALAPTLAPLRPTLDYYPPTPWIGFMLIGAGLGYFLYIRHNFSTFPHFNISTFASLPGKHALLIYMIHQPIILLILYLMHH